jgi:hypothetical protein
MSLQLARKILLVRPIQGHRAHIAGEKSEARAARR